MKEIKLTQGKVALVDDEDFEFLNNHKWCAAKGENTFYATRMEPGNPRTFILMHQQILGFPKEVDHKDGDGLNNKRSNLRACTRSQNHMNRRPKIGCSSRFKGVSFNEKCRIHPWRVMIMVNYKRIYIGFYATEKEAALAYNQKAIELFGEFARLNEIEDYGLCQNY